MNDGFGAIRVNYSILNSWAHGDYERATAPFKGVKVEPTEAMIYGTKKHRAWENEAYKTKSLPKVFGGRKFDDPKLELTTKRIRALNDWCYLTGVLDVMDGDTGIDYKTGRRSASDYTNSKQHEVYQLLYPNLKRFEYYCYNQHAPVDERVTMSIVYLNKHTLQDGAEWVLKMAMELRQYLIDNGLGDKLDQGKGLDL